MSIVLPLLLIGTPQHPSLSETMSVHYRRAKSVHVGMTRAAFEKLYEPDGGLQTIPPSRFVYRDLPYFMVEVEFKFAKPSRHDLDGRTIQSSDPKDRITKLGPIILESKHFR